MFITYGNVLVVPQGGRSVYDQIKPTKTNTGELVMGKKTNVS